MKQFRETHYNVWRRLTSAVKTASMTAMAVLCLFGAFAAAFSPDENTAAKEIRQSLEAGQKAIEEGAQEEAAEAGDNLTSCEEPGTKADGLTSCAEPGTESDDLISYEEYEQAQKVAEYTDSVSAQNAGDRYNEEDSADFSAADDISEFSAAGGITAVGDSVMLGAAGALQKAIPGIDIDAKESRQLSAAGEILSDKAAAGILGSTVIIALGTNGPFSETDGQALISQIGPDRKIYWVLTYGKTLGWQENVNDTIRALASENPNIAIIDWPSLAAQHPDWLYEDGIHLNPEGEAGYAKMIRDALR